MFTRIRYFHHFFKINFRFCRRSHTDQTKQRYGTGKYIYWIQFYRYKTVHDYYDKRMDRFRVSERAISIQNVLRDRNSVTSIPDQQI